MVLPLILFFLLGLVWFCMRRNRDPEQVCTAMLALCVGAVFGFSMYLDQEAFPDDLVTAVGIVFQLLQGDSEDLLEMVKPLPKLLPYAQTLCIVTPVMTAGTAFVFLYRRLPWPVLPPWTCHIFSALDEHSIQLARSIAVKENARFIFLRTRLDDVSADTLLEMKGLWYRFYPHTETDLIRHHLSLWLRPLHFYFLTENSETNFDQMDQFLAQVQAHGYFRLHKGSCRRELFLLSETTSSPMLIDDLRKKYKDLPGTELRLLDRYRASSYHLLKNAPLYKARRDGSVRVLMLGMGRVGQSIFRTMVSMNAMMGCTTTFRLCDRQMTEIYDMLKQQYPSLDDGVTVRKSSFDAESSKLSDLLEKEAYDYLVVALGDDERNLRVASMLYRHYRRKYWAEKPDALPRICVNLEDAVKSRSTAGIYPDRNRSPWEPGFTVFGTDEETFSTEVLLPRGTWLAARKLHTLLSGKEPGPDWCEYERRSSFAAAAHAAVHIASVCPDWAGGRYAGAYLRWAAPFRKELIRAEHRRWMDYVRSEGMTLAEEKIYQEYGPLLESHVDVRGQLSPCLVPSEELDVLYPKLSPFMTSGNNLTFNQRDELVVCNADLLCQIAEKADASIALRTWDQL